jgi:hypothetical protein
VVYKTQLLLKDERAEGNIKERSIQQWYWGRKSHVDGNCQINVYKSKKER